MREGLWTVVIVVSGEGDDPMNDPGVKVGFYNSKDPMVKDGTGNIARRYTFRIAPDAKFEGILKAKTVNGVIVSTEPTKEIWIRDPSYARELQLLQAQLKLKMQDDGTLTGILAGYRPWARFYQGMVEARGSVIEQLFWVELPGVYRALKRNADYSPTGPGGEKTHISYALRIEAIPAFVMTPDAKTQVSSVESYKAIAPPPGPPLHAFITNKYKIVDGIVPDPRTGVDPCRTQRQDPAARVDDERGDSHIRVRSRRRWWGSLAAALVSAFRPTSWTGHPARSSVCAPAIRFRSGRKQTISVPFWRRHPRFERGPANCQAVVASRKSQSRNLAIFAADAFSGEQTIQYEKGAGISSLSGRTRRPSARSRWASALRARATP